MTIGTGTLYFFAVIGGAMTLIGLVGLIATLAALDDNEFTRAESRPMILTAVAMVVTGLTLIGLVTARTDYLNERKTTSTPTSQEDAR